MPRGAFVVLEGIDRSGKSTQVARVAEELTKHGIVVKTMRFPERSTLMGGMINDYLQTEVEMDDRAIHLLFSANRWECAARIRQELESGKTIVCDRYVASGAAFTAAKGVAPLDWCVASDIGLPAPDAIVYLSVPVSVAKERGEYGRERYEVPEYQEKVANAYSALSRVYRNNTWHTIDATRDVDEVTTAIVDRILPIVRSVPEKIKVL